MNIQKKIRQAFFLLLPFGLLVGCESGGGLSAPLSSSTAESSSSSAVEKVDYSKGRAMNRKLGKGINFGNSWESNGNGCLDACWSNPIADDDFKLAKDAGFNSIRLPVNWNRTASNEPPYTVEPERLAGVKRHIQLAIDQGLPVITNIHHFDALYNADSLEVMRRQIAKFAGIWRQLSEAFKEFPDDMLVLEILNEPRNKITKDILNELIDSAYTIIREKNPGKTIMFNPNEYGKFYRMGEMKLPKDGNIIISGHYYELYTFTHQGSHGQKCGNTTWGTTADKMLVTSHFKAYKDTALKYFPDINGGHVPLNNGEFGVSGVRTGLGTNPAICSPTWLFPELTEEEISFLSNAEIAARAFPSDEERGQWTKAVIEATDDLDMSWHYWGFNRVGGYEVYDKGTKEWFRPVLEALIPNSPLL